MWIRHVILELGITLLIVLATIPDLAWARWIVLAYTGLMLLLKVVVLLGGRSLKSIKPTNADVPAWFWHANYAVNIAFLVADGWWIMVAGWALIWVLSIVFERRIGPSARS